VARGAASCRLRKVGHRRGGPLRPRALGWPRSFPRRRPPRDRFQHRRALDPAARPQSQERALRRLRRWCFMLHISSCR
jgi:hypothetical protein